jgi:hypothetical protein
MTMTTATSLTSSTSTMLGHATHVVVVNDSCATHIVDDAGHIIVYLLFTSFYVPRHEHKEG